MDVDADNPLASVPDPADDAWVCEAADRDLVLSRAPEVFPGAWLLAESNPKLTQDEQWMEVNFCFSEPARKLVSSEAMDISQSFAPSLTR